MGIVVAALGVGAFLLSLSSFPLRAAAMYQVDYFSRLRAPKSDGPEAVLSILDTAQNGSGSLCADIYVLSTSGQLQECCGCKMTPNEFRTGAVSKNLLSNNLTNVVLHDGMIKIISSAPKAGVCDPAIIATAGAMDAWITRQDSTGGSAPRTGITTTRFATAPLSKAEENSLAKRCGAIKAIGSGHGICTCPAKAPN